MGIYVRTYAEESRNRITFTILQIFLDLGRKGIKNLFPKVFKLNFLIIL